jgi:IS1 family transposase
MSRRLAGEAEARRRLVQKQARQHWIGLALDATTRQVMAFQVGDRRRKRAKRLGAKMPRAYRQPATCHPDPYGVSAGVMPAAPHRTRNQFARQATHLERCHNTMRQRVSRLGRDARSCSKQLANHSGARKLCIGHYNLTRAAA